MDPIPPWSPAACLGNRDLGGWTTIDFQLGRAGNSQGLGYWDAPGIAHLERHRIISIYRQMERRWRRYSRGPTLAVMAGTIVGANRGGGGQGENCDSMKRSLRDRLSVQTLRRTHLTGHVSRTRLPDSVFAQ